MEKINVIMYSKDNCSLCTKAKHILEEMKDELLLEITEINIYNDDKLLEMYQLTIPVIKINGIEVQNGMINKNVVKEYIFENFGERFIE